MINKKKTLLLLIILILFTFLNGCSKETELDRMLKENGVLALSKELSYINYIDYEVIKSNSVSIYKNKEVIWENNCQNYLPDKLFVILDALEEYSNRMVFTNVHNGRRFLEIIECKNEEYAEKLYEIINSQSYFVYKNLIYRNTPFAIRIVLGEGEKSEFKTINNGKILLKPLNLELYKKDILIIPEEIEIITSTGLSKMTNVEKIICNNNLKVIGESSFSYNSKLEEIVLNEGLEYIDNYAFYTSNIKKITLPNTLKSIGGNVFKNCNNLKYIVLPSSLEYVGYNILPNGEIFCENQKRPKGWDEYFDYEASNTYWAGEWEYNEEGVPTPIE